MDCPYCRQGLMTKDEAGYFGPFLRASGVFFLGVGTLSALYGVLVLLGGNPPVGWEGISPVLFLTSGFVTLVSGAFLNSGHLVWACGNCGACLERRHVASPKKLQPAETQADPKAGFGHRI